MTVTVSLVIAKAACCSLRLEVSLSRIGCICGHTIDDNTDSLPYKASFIPDEDNQLPYRLLAKSVVGLLNAREQGTQREYLDAFLTRLGWVRPLQWIENLLDEEDLEKILDGMVFTVWMGLYERTLYECDDCGRLWVEVDDQHYASYLPEGDERSVLQSLHHHPPNSNE
jgi:hypothetical protein